MDESANKTVKLDEREVTPEQLVEAKQKLEKGKLITEVAPGQYKTLTRFKE